MIGRAFRSVRQKPKAVRDQYAFWIAAVFTGCVALVWFAQLSGQDTNVDIVTDEVDDTPGLEGMFSGFSEQVAALREEVVTAATSTTPATVATPSATTTEVLDFGFTASTTSTATSTPVQPAATTGRPVRIATTSASTSP